MMQQDAATAVGDGFQVAVGICIVSENAFNAGVASVPAPFTDIGWDGWMWHWQGTLAASSTTIDNTLGVTAHREQIDSKAMRKIKLGDVQCAVIEMVENVTATMFAHIETRVLDKLP